MFFFSSRRRHTRYIGDWSSDVCSSDLLVDLRAAGDAIRARRLPMLMNNETHELTIADLEVPAENLVGEEGGGFRAIVDGWNRSEERRVGKEWQGRRWRRQGQTKSVMSD